MLYGLFYMIDSVLGRNDPVRRTAKKLYYKMEGQKALRNANDELIRLEQNHPQYINPDGLKKLK